MGFREIKDQYEQQREAERNKLIAYLRKHALFTNAGLTAVKGGGSGRKEYTSKGRIFPFDLSNWKWVICKNAEDSFNAVISLNMLDDDLSSGNAHALYDRVGLFLTYRHENNTYKISIWTDIDLPFSDESMEKIAKLISEQFGVYNWITH